jgi:signal transduction histidine kinase/ActR/RegA family two-component response regulator
MKNTDGELDVSPDGSGSHRLQLHPLSLTFIGSSSHLEKLFIEDYYSKSMIHIRIVLVLGALLYGSFGILDAVLLPLLKRYTWTIRYAVVCPAILLTALFSFRPWFKKLMQPLFALLLILGGGGIIVMIVLAPSPVNYSYYAGLILVILFGYTLIRARFLWATMFGWLLVLLYEITALFLTYTPLPVLFSNNFFFISANLTGMIACYSMERYARREFFMTRLFAEERKKVTLANTLLERRVRDRTADLERINRDLKQEIAERQRAEEDRILLQQQLKQAEKLETIGRLAAGVAHDLNNILSGVVTLPEILLMDLSEDNPMHTPILTIKQSGQKAAAVVQDLLSLARQGVKERVVFSLNTVVRDYVRSPECEKLRSVHPHVRLETDIRDGLMNVAGSPFHLSKALMNLVINAAEATLVSGTVRISTRNCYLGQPREAFERIDEGEYAVLSVSDTGTGIAEEDLKRVFEPFYSKKRLGRSGTGLGMTVVWSTVKEHGGFIDIQSEEGKGSAVDLYLPLTREKISEADKPFDLKDCQGTETILVVDDVQEQREIATRMLNKLGYEVHTAESGEAALDFLHDRKVDLLVLDMIMDPGIDGCETYRRIIEGHPGQKAVIASGFSESERVREVQRSGAGAYIKKPYTLEQLARAVRSELDRPPS